MSVFLLLLLLFVWAIFTNFRVSTLEERIKLLERSRRKLDVDDDY